MTRHFLGLYVLVVLAVAGVSWGQERLWLAYGNQNAMQDKSLVANLALIEQHVRLIPALERAVYLEQLAGLGLDADVLAPNDITGADTLAQLARGEIAYMEGAPRESWLLKQLDEQSIIALRHVEPTVTRGKLEWLLALLFYAVIALVLMIWLWPLTRDLRQLEQATASFGNRNWLFSAAIKPRSQIYPLAETFRRMAARIDGLISSHKDMSNAVSHEIKTPLSRMQFEIELAQSTSDSTKLKDHLANIKGDIADLNALVTATLDYAILERADMSLNISTHDFTKIIPAITEYVQRDVRTNLSIFCEVSNTATQVVCDAHLLETIVKNLLYNAMRYANKSIRVSFTQGTHNRLVVEDDGPGIPEQDWQRVFGSFVQLAEPRQDSTNEKKKGFGLGLAIVKRAIEWHGGTVAVSRSELGGACFTLTWPNDSRSA